MRRFLLHNLPSCQHVCALIFARLMRRFNTPTQTGVKMEGFVWGLSGAHGGRLGRDWTDIMDRGRSKLMRWQHVLYADRKANGDV